MQVIPNPFPPLYMSNSSQELTMDYLLYILEIPIDIIGFNTDTGEWIE